MWPLRAPNSRTMAKNVVKPTIYPHPVFKSTDSENYTMAVMSNKKVYEGMNGKKSWLEGTLSHGEAEVQHFIF